MHSSHLARTGVERVVQCEMPERDCASARGEKSEAGYEVFSFPFFLFYGIFERQGVSTMAPGQ